MESYWWLCSFDVTPKLDIICNIWLHIRNLKLFCFSWQLLKLEKKKLWLNACNISIYCERPGSGYSYITPPLPRGEVRIYSTLLSWFCLNSAYHGFVLTVLSWLCSQSTLFLLANSSKYLQSLHYFFLQTLLNIFSLDIISPCKLF